MEEMILKWSLISAPSLVGLLIGMLILWKLVQMGIADLRARIEFLEEQLENCLDRESGVKVPKD